MSKRPQIHIFIGAPSIPSPPEAPGQSSSSATAEKWRELHYLCDTHRLLSEKVQNAEHLVFQAERSVVTPAPASSESFQDAEHLVFQAERSVVTPAPASSESFQDAEHLVFQAEWSAVTPTPANGETFQDADHLVFQAERSVVTPTPANGETFQDAEHLVFQAERSVVTPTPANGESFQDAEPLVFQAERSVVTPTPASGETFQDAEPLVFQAERSVVTPTPANDKSYQLSEQETLMAAKGLTSLVPLAITCTSAHKKTICFIDSQMSKDGCAHANVNQAMDQHLQNFAVSARQNEQPHSSVSDLMERKASPFEANSSDISDLVACTKQISIHRSSVGQGVQSDHTSNHSDLSQCFDLPFLRNQESKPKREASDCSDFAVSTETEFCSIMTLSQMAVLMQSQNDMQKRILKLSGTQDGEKNEERHSDGFQCDSNVGTCSNVAENECKEVYASSLELFSSECDRKNICIEATKQEGSAQENTAKAQELNVPVAQFVNEIHIEPLNSGILCSQVDSCHKSSSKRAHNYEDSFPSFHSTLKKDLKSKRAKLNSSPAGPGMKAAQEKTTEFKKLQMKLSLLKNCCCKNQKYNVLVTIVHPCHIKEVQVKSRPKSSCKVPVATIVVIDQSGVERKVVLWQGAAFWSLTVFPGDIVLLTDVIMYENTWCGEIMLQSTFTSQLLNLGNCSALNPEEFYPVVDGSVLHGLLAYISSELPHFGVIPPRQVQRLDSVQYVQLDQLQPNTLVHSVLKIISITILTESLYSYRGGTQRKIILTVEQKRDQHYRMVLWGAGAAWCPQIQRKKDHIWDFKYLLVRCSSVSGDFELHTTPWSSCDKALCTFGGKMLRGVSSESPHLGNEVYCFNWAVQTTYLRC
ncbi:shieldin complex subunit 2 isoform X2 [Pogoniulus pusillus]|uniref:shieldin complex subunit 2 isoform X2 n=1 Tax=Pogoniulus pusillus TaxID=488313 RepID=UPI0030B930EF